MQLILCTHLREAQHQKWPATIEKCKIHSGQREERKEEKKEGKIIMRLRPSGKDSENLIIAATLACTYHCFSHHVKEDGKRQKYRNSCKEEKRESVDNNSRDKTE